MIFWENRCELWTWTCHHLWSQANIHLFIHPADTKQHCQSFGVVSLDTRWTYVHLYSLSFKSVLGLANVEGKIWLYSCWMLLFIAERVGGLEKNENRKKNKSVKIWVKQLNNELKLCTRKINMVPYMKNLKLEENVFLKIFCSIFYWPRTV